MKIYNKKNFALGLLLTLLGLTMLIVSVQKGFDLTGCLILISCLFVGMGLMMRSFSGEMSRADKINDRDERSRLVKLKSRSTAFLCTEILCALCLLGTMLGHQALGEMLSLPMCIAFGFMFFAMLTFELITVLYYEYRT